MITQTFPPIGTPIRNNDSSGTWQEAIATLEHLLEIERARIDVLYAHGGRLLTDADLIAAVTNINNAQQVVTDNLVATVTSTAVKVDGISTLVDSLEVALAEAQASAHASVVELQASIVELQADTAGLRSTVTTTFTQVQSDIAGLLADAASLYSDVGSLHTQVTDNLASVTSVIDSIHSDITGLLADAASLYSDVGSLHTQVTDNLASVTSVIDSIHSDIADINSSNATAAAALAAEIALARSEEDTIRSNVTTVTSDLLSEIDNRISGDLVIQSSLTALIATVGTNTASITSEAVTRATADNAASVRLDTVEASTASNSATITSETLTRTTQFEALSASITNLSSSLNSGQDLSSTLVYNFNTTVEGWSGSGGSLSIVDGDLRITSTGSNPQISKTGLTLNGSQDFVIQVRMQRIASAGWTGRAYYSTASHGFTSGYYKEIADPGSSLNVYSVLEFDMSNLTVGGTDWISETITGIRLDLGANSSDVIDVDWITVGSTLQSAIAAAISLEAYTRSTADAALSATITTLTSTVNSNTAAITNEATTRATADTSLSNTISTLTSTVSGNTAAISSEASTRATADTALSSSITSLTSTVNTNNTNVNASITTEATTRATADTAINATITTLTSTVNTNNTNVNAAITSEAATRASADTALSATITTLTSTVNTNNTNVNSAITSEAATRASADTAINSTITTLTSTVNTNNTNVNASITSEAATRASADTAINATITTLTSTVNTNNTNVNTAITNEATTRASADTAINATITTLTSTVNTNNTNVNASITSEAATRATADTAINATITTLTSTVNSNTSAITTEATTRATADTALSGTITTLTSTVNSNTSAITSEAATRATADTAINATITTLTSTVNTNNTNVNASITSEAATRATADTAINATITTLTSTVNTNTAAITSEGITRANADTAISGLITNVSARISPPAGACMDNPGFSDWPDGQALPTGWNDWADGISHVSRVAGRGKPYALDFNDDAGTAYNNGLGFYAEPNNLHWIGPSGQQYFVVELDFVYVSGDLSNAFFYIQGYDAGNAGINYCGYWQRLIDAIGETPVPGKLYSIRKVIKFEGAFADAVRYNIHLMAHWSDPFGAHPGLVHFKVEHYAWRVPSAEEIRTFNVASEISAAVNTETVARVAADSALAALITALQTSVANNSAQINLQAVTQTDALTALAALVATLQTEVAGNTAGITQEATARSNAITALTDLYTALQTSVAGNTSSITLEISNRTTAVNALAAIVTALQATVAGNTASISQQSATQADQYSALSGLITQVRAASNSDAGGFMTNPIFSDWPDGQTLPSGWDDWVLCGPGAWAHRVAGKGHQYALNFDMQAAAANCGIGFNSTGTGLPYWSGPQSIRYMVVEIDFELVSGPIAGAGWYITGYTSGGAWIGTVCQHPLSEDVPAPVLGRVYQIRKVIDLGSNFGVSERWQIHFMATWDGFDAAATQKNITLHRYQFRAATTEEIRTFNVASEISAAVNSETVARTSADGALASQLNTVSAQTAANAAAGSTETIARTNADSALAAQDTLISARTGKQRLFKQPTAPSIDDIAPAGVNMIFNAGALNAADWAVGGYHPELMENPTHPGRNGFGNAYCLPGENTLWNHRGGVPPGGEYSEFYHWYYGDALPMPVTAGQTYEAQALLGNHRGAYCELYIFWYDAANTLLTVSNSNHISAQFGGVNLSDWGKAFVIAVAPTNATQAMLLIRQLYNGTESEPYIFATRLMFARALPGQTTPSPWNAGIDSVWYNTSDGNKAHIWKWNAWVATDDARISYAAAAWTVQVDVNGYISGMSLIGAAAPGQTPQSEFKLIVDYFKLYSPSNSGLGAVPVFEIGTVGGAANITLNGNRLADNAVSNGTVTTTTRAGGNTSTTLSADATLTIRSGSRLYIAISCKPQPGDPYIGTALPPIEIVDVTGGGSTVIYASTLAYGETGIQEISGTQYAVANSYAPSFAQLSIAPSAGTRTYRAQIRNKDSSTDITIFLLELAK